jgi:hypothetical protein
MGTELHAEHQTLTSCDKRILDAGSILYCMLAPRGRSTELASTSHGIETAASTRARMHKLARFAVPIAGHTLRNDGIDG